MSVAKQASFLCNGYELACFLKSFKPEAEAEALDATVLCNNYRSYAQGFKSGNLSAEGLFSADTVNADEIHDRFAAAYTAGTPNVITASFGQIAIGDPAILLYGPQLKYSIDDVVGQLIMVMAEFQASDGLGFGNWLLNNQLNAGTTNGTAVDNGGATANGGVLHVHLNNSTATDVDVKVQHSSNGSSWSDLTGAEVNNLSAAHAAGSATVAPGTAVARYVRAVAVVTGGNTDLVSAAFARR